MAVALLGLLCWALPVWADSIPPHGWTLQTGGGKDYDSGLDLKMTHGGHASGYLRCLQPSKNAFATLMQTCLARNYLGKKVKMSAWMRVEGVDSWAGLWLRVDARNGAGLSFDDMHDRPVKGTMDWKQYSITLDVPEQSSSMSFGTLLYGGGEVWMADFKFDVVGQAGPNTRPGTSFPPEPVNLDFAH